VTKLKKSRIKHRIAKSYNRFAFLYFVNARLIHDGITLDFPLLFDTGATHTGISRESFDQLGIDEIADKAPTITAIGTTYLPYGIVESLVLDGAVVMEQVRVNILSDQFFKDYYNAGYRNIGGILGGSFLSRIEFFMGYGVIDIFYEPKKTDI